MPCHSQNRNSVLINVQSIVMCFFFLFAVHPWPMLRTFYNLHMKCNPEFLPWKHINCMHPCKPGEPMHSNSWHLPLPRCQSKLASSPQNISSTKTWKQLHCNWEFKQDNVYKFNKMRQRQHTVVIVYLIGSKIQKLKFVGILERENGSAHAGFETHC